MAHRRSFRSGPRRQTQWDSLFNWTAQLFSAPGEGFVMAFSEFNNVITVGPVPPPTPLTITRTILSWNVLGSEAGGLRFFGAIGMCVVTQDALDQALLGIKSIPLPVTDASSDVWFLHSFLGGISPDSVNGQVGTGNVGVIESRAQRKIDDGQQIVLMAERDPEIDIPSAGRFELSVNLRALVKVS